MNTRVRVRKYSDVFMYIQLKDYKYKLVYNNNNNNNNTTYIM